MKAMKTKENIIRITIKIKKLFYKCSTLILFIISYYIYHLSLEPCFEGEEICGNNMKWIYKKVFQIILASELISFLFIKILLKRISNFHFIHIVIIISLFYYQSHDYFFANHGMYNLIVFAIILIINILIIIAFKTIIFVYKLKNKINYKFFIITFLSLVYHFKLPNVDCSGWDRGLNNTYIENDVERYGCSIKIPKYCQYKVLSQFLDFTKIFHLNCSLNKVNSRKNIFKYSHSPYITKQTKKFGFPLTNKGLIGSSDGLDESLLKEYVLNNLFDLENNYNNFSEPEIMVDFSKNGLGELNINLHYNDSLSKERKKLESKNNPYSNNIMIIYIDSVSRACSMRQLNKTLSFYEKFISYEGGFNEKYPDEKFHSFQYFKYHSFEGRTAGNYPPLYYGNKREAQNITRINKYFKENGYITNYCCDLCKKDNSRTLHNLTQLELYDHQMLLCDPNVIRYHKPIQKCLYGQVDVGYLFNYSEQFWRKYKDNRKLSNIIINVGHEGTMEALKHYDDVIFNYLESLYNDNLFKDTSIILLSDHGVGIQSVYYVSEFFQLEKVLPMLYLIINDRKNISYEEQYFYLHQNQQTFITAYDIYNTLNHLLYGDNYKYISNLTDENPTPKSSLGNSLFERIDQKSRKPKNYEPMYQKVCI